ncbi:hydrolase [Cladophialophora carrionii]|uniref:Hydrolase n=1 Tax=Cladophialophora carrionii TaxID=86049 RepID=A0A1C1CTM0_9EURO|nr:hydrolase [Cladophialophora carrionii]
MDYHSDIASVGHSYHYAHDRNLTSEPDTSPPQAGFAQLSTLSSLPETPSESVQVISSLIDSLSKISASTYVRQDPVAETNIHISTDEYSRSPSTEPPDADDLDREQNDPPLADESSEGEAAAPPVIKYARRPPPLSKRSSRSFIRSLSMSSQPALAPRESIHSLKSRAESDSVGLPSIERRNRSSAGSTFSFVSGLSSTLKRQTAESVYEMTTTRPIPPRRVSSDRRRKAESLYSMEQEKENKWPTRSPSVDGYSSSSTPLDQSPADGPTVAALRLSRGDLGSHLIPSRRSSLRRSVTGISDASQDQHNRYSFSGRDLKELNIDAELIEGDNSTVRRIRELQEAREKRQKEWRHEARKSERASKRHTIATPKLSSRRSSPYQSSRLSVTEVVVESPEVESPLDLSATVTPSDLAGMPAFATEPPKERPSSPVDARPATSNPPPSAALSRDNSLYQNAGTHTQRNSAGFTIKQDPALVEMKSITEEVEAFLGAPRFTQKIRHPRTGRTIAFSEVGDPNGFVVLCCVGMGLTRYLTAFYDELARTLRLRLITPDRPGVGASSPLSESQCTPLNWVDDVAVLCNSLEITRFSLLAHSAGAIYALATALKMPQYVRGRIHLLAPWIPPSQMPKGAALGPDSQPIANLPFTHKILSVLPAQILKVANSRFLTATSASVDTKPLKSKKNKQIQIESLEVHLDYPHRDLNEDSPFRADMPEVEPERPSTGTPNRARGMSCYQANNESLGIQGAAATSPKSDPRRQTFSAAKSPAATSRPMSPRLSPEARQALYNQTLTHRIWTLATQNANPASDLVVCLERRRPIGFRYPEVTRSVVIHHGAKDSRVPLDNVRWLRSVMKRCELKVLDDEGHGLMASASAMAAVLGEIAKEWEEWERIAQNKEKRKRSDAASTFSRGRSFHSRFVDASYREAASRDS